MNTRVQARLFGESDLPLFSGTPVRGEVETFAPEPVPDATQLELLGDVEPPVCDGTGAGVCAANILTRKV